MPCVYRVVPGRFVMTWRSGQKIRGLADVRASRGDLFYFFPFPFPIGSFSVFREEIVLSGPSEMETQTNHHVRSGWKETREARLSRVFSRPSRIRQIDGLAICPANTLHAQTYTNTQIHIYIFTNSSFTLLSPSPPSLHSSTTVIFAVRC